MTDELDLIGELRDAEPLRPEAYRRARAVLRAAIAEPGTVRLLGALSVEDTTMETTTTLDTKPVPGHAYTPAVRNRRKISGAGRLGIGAGVGVAAAAAVVAVAVASGSTGGTVPQAGPAGTGEVAAPPAAAPAVGPLMTLAGSIKANSPSTGDAWLVVSTQVHGKKTMQVNYTLYTDSHKIYSGYNVKDIKRAITRHQDQAESGGYAPVVKAAILAANSSPAEGRTRMLQAAEDPLVGLAPAAQKKEWDKGQAERVSIIKRKGGGTVTPKPYSSQAVEEHFDNVLWTFSTEALSAGDGNTLVRQGVLRLLSTISGVSVAKSTTDGKATLTITAGPEVFAGGSSEVLTIDAKTGMLVKDVSNIPGLPKAYTTYKSSRVTTADL
jgi:hypothetical protein